jgi:hypothetical protein
MTRISWGLLAITPAAACAGNSGGPDAGTDGGFADASVVVVPPTHVVDESRDLGLLFTMRALPNDDPENVQSVIEITAYDTDSGDLAWSDREEFWGEFLWASSRPDSQTGDVQVLLRAVNSPPDRPTSRSDYDPRRGALVDGVEVEIDAYQDPLDFGQFIVRSRPQAGSWDMRVFGREVVDRYMYERYGVDPGRGVPDIGPRTIVWSTRRGPGGTLMLDAARYAAPEAQTFPADGGVQTLFVEQRIEGVFDVFLVEPSTANVVGVGERRPPEVPRLTDGRELAHLVDRRGRVYYRNDDHVTREPLYRAGIDGSVEEITLDWGDALECVLTRIVDVGPEGHVLTRQRPGPGLRGPVDGAVCLFAPDGSLVLTLPPDPERAWVGFSDPVQWY